MLEENNGKNTEESVSAIKQLLSNSYVARVSHYRNWVGLMENAMKIVNPEIQFETENTKLWKENVEANYDELHKSR